MLSPFLTCYLNLIKAITGTGIIFYPIYFNKLGIPLTLFGIGTTIFFSQSGLYLYCYINKKKGPSSLAGLSNLYKTKYVRYLSDLAVISKTLVVSSLYFSMLQKYFCLMFDSERKSLIMFLFSALIYPLCSMKRIKHLKYASMAAVSATFYLIILVFFTMAFKSEKTTIEEISNKEEYSKFLLFLKKIPFFVFSFTAHHTIISLQNDFHEKSLKFFAKVVVSACMTVGLIYSLFGIFVNKLYNLNSLDFKDDVLPVLPQNIWFSIGKYGYILLISLSIPLQLIPCRNHLVDLFSRNRRKEKKIRYIYSFFILLFIFSVNFLDIKMNVFQTFSGGVCSSILCFLLPFLLLRKMKMVPAHLRVLSQIIFVFGVFVFTVFLYDFFSSLN